MYCNYFFQNFGKKWKIGDEPIVGDNFRIQHVFFLAKVEGTRPATRKWFIVLEIIGEIAEVLVFSRAEGKGSRRLVEGFIYLMMSSTSSCGAAEKKQRG